MILLVLTSVICMPVVCCWSVRQSATGCCRVTWCDGDDLTVCISSSRRLDGTVHMAGWSCKKSSKKRARTPEVRAWNGNSVSSATLNWLKQVPRSATRTPPLYGRCCKITLKTGMGTGKSIIWAIFAKTTMLLYTRMAD